MAVNGRGVPDEDITARGDQQVRLLMRRGVAFAWEALHALGISVPGHAMIARVSASEVLASPGEFTGHVTFFSAAFADAMRVGHAVEGEGIQVYLFSEQCAEPLAAGTASA